ncbi:MAG: SDR family oxidoreductase [Candidatus Pristimantibacillus lignocellulolyticus]|uniref:SDR family oxidoreductase n=1 Tax=Candidatus Pristimantibacillus lignocellulolyticus TaxID=2994561 RepID=A0A9J6ZH71_9BACL|nr:MAG: SDR family oxidoreductase [Candidatus Pristimantibacillus lignocellulolyticus]
MAMKLFVIGATGGVGKEVVKQALEAGYEVTAFVRDPSKVSVEHAHLQIVQGDGLDKNSVITAMQGHDAVICTIGGKNLGASTLMSTVTQHLIEGMKQHNIERIVYCASAGIHKELKGMMGKLAMFVLRKVLADHTKAYGSLVASKLRWTIARPMSLTNGPLVGTYSEVLHGGAPKGYNIARADVATFMLKAVQDNQYIEQSVGLSS